MYAVFQVGGFQYTAEEGVNVQVPRLKAGEGDKFEIEEVMLISDGDNSQIGQPFIENAKIEAEVVGHGKGEKVIVYKAKRRTKYRLTRGHRQDFSEIRINKIVVPSA